MSDDVAVVKRAFSAFERSGTPSYDVLHPDVTWTNSAGAREAKTYRGHRGVDAWVHEWGEAMAGRWAFDALEFEQLPGGKVLALSRIRGQGAASGLDVDVRFWTVVEVRDGLIVSAHGFDKRADALEAAATV